MAITGETMVDLTLARPGTASGGKEKRIEVPAATEAAAPRRLKIPIALSSEDLDELTAALSSYIARRGVAASAS